MKSSWDMYSGWKKEFQFQLQMKSSEDVWKKTNRIQFQLQIEIETMHRHKKSMETIGHIMIKWQII